MYKIMTDSECGLPEAFLNQHEVGVVRSFVQLEDHQFGDYFYDQQNTAAFYDTLKHGGHPTTSQISIGEYVAAFEGIIAQHIPIIFIGMSKGLSGSFNSANQARDILLEKYPDAQLMIVDTLAACAGEGLLVIKAVQLRQAGMSLDEAVTQLNACRLQVHHFFTVDNLKFLYQGGRLSKRDAVLGDMLHIKPILDVDAHGKLRVIKKVRTSSRAFKTLADMILADIQADDQTVLISTSGDWEAAETVRKQIQGASPKLKLMVTPIGPTIASHTGYGCLGVFTMGKTPRQ
ncbi:DegV family protein [Levilactobacillus brevis]|mgnify:FL=1|uniref:DegV family protein n=1 Tax=Levilactobacillus brevis TaxID=1580 RepID=UPI0005B63105|nr:DegV family protein [Levilactobacillus brevis]KIR09790.1 DegV family protein [Levilactobacillus brevis]